jgi:uncharacterized protein
MNASPKGSAVSVDCDVEAVMRDGVVLRADIYSPAHPGQFPAILIRTPYDKSDTAVVASTLDPLRAALNGYVVVVQDTRGRWASDGIFEPFFHEISDGYDSVEWIAAQSWSSGSVGMAGSSYAGYVQWLAALACPPHLKAIVPRLAPSDAHRDWVYQRGVLQLGFALSWIVGSLADNELARLSQPSHEVRAAQQKLIRISESLDALFSMAPRDAAIVLDELGVAPYFNDWIDREERDPGWETVGIPFHADRIRVPALSIGGWYDVFLQGTLANYSHSRTGAGTSEARAGQRLIVGPWRHGDPTLGNPIGEADFGPRSTGAAIDVPGLTFRFFDHWLKGKVGIEEDQPPVRLFVMGDNLWRDEDEWPLRRAELTKYYLHSGGHANSDSGDGKLSSSLPHEEPFDSYTYDPAAPVPTRGGQLCCSPVTLPPGAFDQRSVELRHDVLVYSSDPLSEDVEVTGDISAVLYATSSAPDTDFTAKLVDVFPSGYARNIADGIVRARWRNGPAKAPALTPGVAERFEIDLVATSNVFKKGHRLRLEISSSNFPRFHRHPNTSKRLAEAGRARRAVQQIHHDRVRPSALVLPMVPRGPDEENL